MIGQTLGHYRIDEKIGAGGMGAVYRARDLRLERDVAVKVLPAGTLADEDARKRFRKEALALAKLNHPHVAAVYDFDSQEGVDFLVMELVEGATLADKLKAGSLPEKELAGVGMQVAEALSEAHEQGIVHRDLKPGNLKLTPKGQVKVLDFGIAKLLPAVGPGFSQGATTESFTESHLLVGTLPYMSPEQLRGEAVDARSDLYSLGVVLYELATGRRPFEQKVSTALSDAILHQPAPSPARLKPDLSPRLEEIILKCLEKEPENRYQSAKELAVDLRRLTAPAALPLAPSPQPAPRFLAGAPAWGRIGSRWQVPPGSAMRLALGLVVVAVVVAVLLGLNVGGLRERLFGTTTPKIESLAVLPLANLSGDPEQEYFSEGMTEALITELAQIKALKVISRTSAMQYKGVHKPMRQIAKELDVDAVVEGSVQRASERVRVSAQLIHARTDTNLWAGSYERDLRDLLALESEVAQAIAREIQVKLTPQEQARLASGRRVTPEAHEAYLKGRYYWNRYQYQKALESFQHAIRVDPTYAAAYAGLADTYYALSGIFMAPSEALPKARVAALKALELDDSLAEAYASLGVIQLADYDWNWSAAQDNFERAIMRNPNYAAAHQWYGNYLLFLGRFSQALPEYRTAKELDPLSPTMASWYAYALYIARRHDEAIQQAQKALELEANFLPTYLALGLAYGQKGMWKQAIGEFEKAMQLLPENEVSKLLRAQALVKVGRRAEASQTLEEAKRRVARNPAASSYHIAVVSLALGEREQALQWLERAYEARSEEFLLVKVDPLLDDLHTDARFQDLLRRMNFPSP